MIVFGAYLGADLAQYMLGEIRQACRIVLIEMGILLPGKYNVNRINTLLNPTYYDRNGLTLEL